MESQDKEEQYKHSVWEIYRREWATASPEKRIELNKRMLRWQELIKNGWTASQAYYQVLEEESAKTPAYYRVMEEESAKTPSYSFWSQMRKVPFVILGLALVAAIVYSVIITGDRNALNTELESVQSKLTSVQADLASTQSELNSTKQTLTSTKQTLASTESELSSTKQTLASTQGKLEAAEAELKLYKETLGVQVFSGVQPLTQKGEANLNNVPSATNPSWQQLISFLLADSTDDKYYREDSFICIDFAKMLHDNAEDAGIKAAFVAVSFEGKEVGHALNAFKTTDKGLVYVDCTGKGFQLPTFEEWQYEQSYPTEWDKIAYVLKDKQFGSISLGRHTPLDYDSYEKMQADWHSWVQKLEAYNKEVEEYNREIFGKVYYIGSAELERIKEWERTLEVRKGVLDSMRAQLEKVWPTLGTVTNIKIYW